MRLVNWRSAKSLGILRLIRHKNKRPNEVRSKRTLEVAMSGRELAKGYAATSRPTCKARACPAHLPGNPACRLRPAGHTGPASFRPPLPLPPCLMSSALPHIPIAPISLQVMEPEELKPSTEACEARLRLERRDHRSRLFRHHSRQPRGRPHLKSEGASRPSSVR